MNIVLIGMPASGKTTVSKILAEKLGAETCDTDALIVERYGEISKIFERYGESYFRGLEKEAVKTASGKTNAVISTGGGCVLFKENVENLKKSGKIVYLRASADTLIKRTAYDSSRPLISGEREEKIKKLLSERTALYEQAADFTVDVDGVSPEEIAKKITEFIK